MKETQPKKTYSQQTGIGSMMSCMGARTPNANNLNSLKLDLLLLGQFFQTGEENHPGNF